MNVSNVGPRFVRMRSVGLLLVGLGLGYLAGIAAAPSASARAEVTEEPRREAFKAGGVLNEPVLREINATLLRIETRVERIEKTIVPQTSTKPGTTKPVPVKK